MSIGQSFDTGVLRIRLKTAEDKVRAFESGEKYVQMQEQFRAAFRGQNARIRKLEEELGKAHAQTVSVRKIWSEIFDDVYREADAGKFALRKEIARLGQRVLEVERQRDATLERLRDKNHELYETKTALYEAEQKIAGLTARINKNYTNSSKSSSQSPGHKIIPNGREKSGKKTGGQKGHIHHERKRMEPTQVIAIPAPSIYRDDPNFKETGKTIHKQLVKLHVGVEVMEYNTPEFRNRTTGQRVHAAFPEGFRQGLHPLETGEGGLPCQHPDNLPRRRPCAFQHRPELAQKLLPTGQLPGPLFQGAGLPPPQQGAAAKDQQQPQPFGHRIPP